MFAFSFLLFGSSHHSNLVQGSSPSLSLASLSVILDPFFHFTVRFSFSLSFLSSYSASSSFQLNWNYLHTLTSLQSLSLSLSARQVESINLSLSHSLLIDLFAFHSWLVSNNNCNNCYLHSNQFDSLSLSLSLSFVLSLSFFMTKLTFDRRQVATYNLG